MSKSKGNVIDPIEIIGEYGTDAIRLALCSSVTGARQIDLDRRRFEEFKNFANKVWNGARFVMMNLETAPALTSESISQGLDFKLLTLEDRWILSVLNRTIVDINKNLSQYSFDRVAARAYEFYWNDFCALYVELAKPVLTGKMGTPEIRENKQKILSIVLCAAIRLLHPIAPFITEEIFSLLKGFFPALKPKKKSDPYTLDFFHAILSPACIVAPYPSLFDESHIDPAIESTFEQMFKLISAVRNIRAEMQIPPGEKTELYLYSPNLQMIQEHHEMILALTPTSTLHFVQNETEMPSFGAATLIDQIKLMVPIPDSLKDRERQRLEKEMEKLEKQRSITRTKLSNPDFRAKAPAEIVKGLEQALTQNDAQIALILQKLQSLKAI